MVKRGADDSKGRTSKILMVLTIIIAAIAIAGVFFYGLSKPKTERVLENPLKEIIDSNTKEGKINYDKVVEQGVLNFNEEYINYLLIALGVGNLYSSILGYGSPVVEFKLDNGVWNSEIINKNLITKKRVVEEKDLIISMSKEEAVRALLSNDIKEFMKNSVKSGNTKIEMNAGAVELGSKGYLKMYKELTS